jgi:hypothetical protein
LITRQANLPFADPEFSTTALNEGINCSTCHKYDINEVPIIGYASETELQKNFNAGTYMFGPFGDPLENSFHESAQSSLLADGDDADQLCSSCHQPARGRGATQPPHPAPAGHRSEFQRSNAPMSA